MNLLFPYREVCPVGGQLHSVNLTILCLNRVTYGVMVLSNFSLDNNVNHRYASLRTI